MSSTFLIVRVTDRLCALPLGEVDETMRCPPCEPLPNVPAFVSGASIVRGRPTAVVDLNRLLDDGCANGQGGQRARLVTLRTTAHRSVGLAVDEVLGIRDGTTWSAAVLPSLLSDAADSVVRELGRLDGQLLTVLRAGSLLPDSAWAASDPETSE